MCNKITVIVNDLKKQYGKKIVIKTISMKAKGSREAVKAAKLTNHGIIAKDVNGKIVATVDGHNYKKPKVEEVMKKLISK